MSKVGWWNGGKEGMGKWEMEKRGNGLAQVKKWEEGRRLRGQRERKG